MKSISSREVSPPRLPSGGDCTRIFSARTTCSRAHREENTASSNRPCMIALLDYGSGNLRSVEKALRKVGGEVRLITRPEAMKEARAVVLPGVGAFDDCVTAMQKQ